MRNRFIIEDDRVAIRMQYPHEVIGHRLRNHEVEQIIGVGQFLSIGDLVMGDAKPFSYHLCRERVVR